MKTFRFGVCFIFVFFLAGCAQLMRGQLQPVKSIDPNNGIFETTCSGAVEEWGTCFSKAKSTCKKGYTVLSKTEKPGAAGVYREFTFQCK